MSDTVRERVVFRAGKAGAVELRRSGDVWHHFGGKARGDDEHDNGAEAVEAVAVVGREQHRTEVARERVVARAEGSGHR